MTGSSTQSCRVDRALHAQLPKLLAFRRYALCCAQTAAILQMEPWFHRPFLKSLDLVPVSLVILRASLFDVDLGGNFPNLSWLIDTLQVCTCIKALFCQWQGVKKHWGGVGDSRQTASLWFMHESSHGTPVLHGAMSWFQLPPKLVVTNFTPSYLYSFIWEATSSSGSNVWGINV